MTSRTGAFRFLALPLLLAGCMVGPKYKRPSAPVPTVTAYKESVSRGTWKVANPSDAMLRGEWWRVFREPELDALERRLNLDNQTIKQAFQLFMAARAQIREAKAGYYPSVTAGPSATLSRSSGTVGLGGGQTSGIFSAPLEISWAPDLFGRVQNTVREFQYGAQISAADLESQRLLEQATLAQTYFAIRGQDALQDLLDDTVKADTQIVAVTRTLYETGIATDVAVAQAEETLAAAREQASNVGISRAQDEHAIATLLGVSATDFTVPKRALLVSPPSIPTGTPSELLERRPDIAIAEWQMAQANALLGIGYAAFYPTLTLSASGGLASTALRTLFGVPSIVWSLGASAAQTIFDAGLRRATVEQYWYQYNATVANYRQTVLAAFQQVEDYLAQAVILSRDIEEQERVVGFAQKAFDLEKARYEQGIDPYLNLMTQQTILLGAQQTLVNLKVSEMTSTVLLVLALGGGWARSDISALMRAPQPPSH